jgi:hypothetical protein
LHSTHPFKSARKFVVNINNQGNTTEQQQKEMLCQTNGILIGLDGSVDRGGGCHGSKQRFDGGAELAILGI